MYSCQSHRELPSKSKPSIITFYRMCLHCNEGKLLNALMLQSDHKSPLIKSQIARCFEQLIRQLG